MSVVPNSFSFDGFWKFYVEEKLFILRPLEEDVDSDIFGILFNISSKNIEGEKLVLRVFKDSDDLALMTLEKVDTLRHGIEILDLILEKSSIMVSDDSDSSSKEPALEKTNKLSDLSKFKLDKYKMRVESKQKEYEEVDKAFSMNGRITLVEYTRLVSAKFQIDDNEYFEYTIKTNPENNIFESLNDIFDDGIYSTFGIYKDCARVDVTVTFDDLAVNDRVVFDVSLPCTAASRLQPHFTVEIPWIENVFILERRLSTILALEPGGIRFFDDKGQQLDEAVDLDIEKCRSNEDEFPRIVYEICGSKVMCRTLLDDEQEFVLTIPANCTSSDVKRRLGRRLDVDWERFVISQNGGLLKSNCLISADGEINYIIALTLEDYTLGIVVGQGGFGKVSTYVSTTSKKTIALKRFSFALDNQSTWKSFAREWRTIMHLTPHPNILRYENLFVDNDDVCIGMEFMVEGSLRIYIDRNKSLSDTTIKMFSIGILRGLGHLHDNKIRHGDIKGDNVLLGEGGVVKLSDFGLSAILTNVDFGNLSHTVAHTHVCGTYRWMAPEMVIGTKLKTRNLFKPDIWSVGATLIEMITGKVPRPDLGNMEAGIEIAKAGTIEYEKGGVSVELQDLVQYCLTVDVTRRPDIHGLMRHGFLSG